MKGLRCGLLAVILASTPAAFADERARVTLGGVLIVEFRAATGGFSPEQRKVQVQNRVVEILSRPELTPGHVRVVPRRNGRSARVMVGQLLLVTATTDDAAANQSTPVALAKTWAENFRRGFAAAKPKPVQGG